MMNHRCHFCCPGCCISFCSYIKPQLFSSCSRLCCVVYRSIPTSNRNLLDKRSLRIIVVYRSIPTSNRNPWRKRSRWCSLYIVLFLHQTATCFCCSNFAFWLYIVLFLHQTATLCPSRYVCCMLYIVLFLHQTATARQPTQVWLWLYIVLFLHQTATLHSAQLVVCMLYIVLFLHQTATTTKGSLTTSCCISFYSYIKPQHERLPLISLCVVYRSIPTSNRNKQIDYYSFVLLYIVLFLHQTATVSSATFLICSLYIVLFLHQTATGTMSRALHGLLYIVLFLHQTATSIYERILGCSLYIVLFLHQTATKGRLNVKTSSCISFYSYIKPQHHGKLLR